jgi:pyridoxal 5'-phosphate synthase pdxS subunit
VVQAVTHYDDPEALLRVSEGLGEPMRGLDVKELPEEQTARTTWLVSP